MSKKQVQYVPSQSYGITLGESAKIVAVDHPDYFPGANLTTSEVVSVNQNGVFETLNTIYYPVQQLNG